MAEPIISVNMITYNHEPYISQAIECVLKQKTDFPFELVIGEDCSTDGTRKIVMDYAKNYPDIIRVISSEKNVGAANNSKRTIQACRGKYIAWCEGDDYWHNPDKLQKQAEYLENNPECDLIFADCNCEDITTKEIINSCNCANGFKDVYQLIADEVFFFGGGPYFFTCTAFARRKLVNDLLNNDPYLYGDTFLMTDMQYWTEISLSNKVFYIPECYATYRILGESASHSSNPIKKTIFAQSSFQMILYLCKKHNFPENIRKKAEILYNTMSLKLAYYSGDKNAARNIMKTKENITVADWLYYFGAKNRRFYHFTRKVISVKNFLKVFIKQLKN